MVVTPPSWSQGNGPRLAQCAAESTPMPRAAGRLNSRLGQRQRSRSQEGQEIRRKMIGFPPDLLALLLSSLAVETTQPRLKAPYAASRRALGAAWCPACTDS